MTNTLTNIEHVKIQNTNVGNTKRLWKVAKTGAS